jgi:hypothetical protein
LIERSTDSMSFSIVAPGRPTMQLVKVYMPYFPQRR